MRRKRTGNHPVERVTGPEKGGRIGIARLRLGSVGVLVRAEKILADKPLSRFRHGVADCLR